MPLTNLCNQLVVIGTRKIFRLSNVWLSPFRPPLPALRLRFRAFARMMTQSFPRWRWLAASGYPASSKNTVGAVLLAETIPALPLGVLGIPERDSRRPIESLASREHVASDTSCRAPPFPRQRRVHREEPELFPPATHQRGWLSKLEAPSSDRSLPPHPSPKLRMGLSGCHWYLRFAASAQLPTCVHARLSRARLIPRWLLPQLGL